MFRLIPREEKFFDKFEGQVENIMEVSPYLLQMAGSTVVDPLWHKFIGDLEHQGDVLAEKSYKDLKTTFITPLDREDIYKLISALDDILDFIEEAVWKIVNYSLVGDTSIGKFLDIVRESIVYVRDGVFSLRKLNHEKFERASEKMVDCEHAADQLEREIIKDSYKLDTVEVTGKSPSDPVTHEDEQKISNRRNQLRMRREIAEILEEAVDACRDTFHIIGEIMTKNA